MIVGPQWLGIILIIFIIITVVVVIIISQFLALRRAQLSIRFTIAHLLETEPTSTGDNNINALYFATPHTIHNINGLGGFCLRRFLNSSMVKELDCNSNSSRDPRGQWKTYYNTATISQYMCMYMCMYM